MIVVAGPPGSGKTTFFPVVAFGVDAFNIDDRCAHASDERASDQAELARKHGFATELRFVATDSIAENVERVLQRAQGGGHGASERDVRAIHERGSSVGQYGAQPPSATTPRLPRRMRFFAY